MRTFSFIILLGLTSCQRASVEAPTTERYEACEVGWSCAVHCEMPTDALLDLGCAPGDFASTPPNCRMEDNCANAKSECFSQCEADLPADEQLDCKIECNDTFGTEGTCKQEFELWKAARAEVLRPLSVCLSPCEGRPSRLTCLEDPSQCDPVIYARHKGVSQMEACLLGDESACTWTCDDNPSGFPAAF
jgi:hypothetical protein